MDPYPVPDLGEVDLVAVLAALGDPIRLRMVQALLDGQPRSKSSGTWGFDVQKSTLSHHFRVLREAGLTRTIVEGRTHSIQLRKPELDERFPGLLAALATG